MDDHSHLVQEKIPERMEKGTQYKTQIEHYVKDPVHDMDAPPPTPEQQAHLDSLKEE